jgi:hypothetical protein
MALSAFATRSRATLNVSRGKAGVAVASRPSRVIARAADPESSASNSAAPAEAKVYFGGKEYTEEQVSRRVRRDGRESEGTPPICQAKVVVFLWWRGPRSRAGV